MDIISQDSSSITYAAGIGVIFLSEFEVGLLNVTFVSPLGNPQHVVKVPFGGKATNCSFNRVAWRLLMVGRQNVEGSRLTML